MTVLGAILGWTVVAGLFWIAALAFIAAVLVGNPVFLAFAGFFGALALYLAVKTFEEGW